MKFDGRLLIIGCGSVSQCAVPLVLKFIDMPAKNITIMDFVDNRPRVKDALDRGVHYVFDRVTEENYQELLARYVGAGDLIIDLAWNIECNAMLQWCRDRQVLYVNTSVEVWNPYQDSQRNDPTQYTLYHRHMTMRMMIEKWGDNKGTSAVVDHGANPAWSRISQHPCSHREKILKENPGDAREGIRRALAEKISDSGPACRRQSHPHQRARTQVTDNQSGQRIRQHLAHEASLKKAGARRMGWGTHERTFPRTLFPQNGREIKSVCARSA